MIDDKKLLIIGGSTGLLESDDRDSTYGKKGLPTDPRTLAKRSLVILSNTVDWFNTESEQLGRHGHITHATQTAYSLSFISNGIMYLLSSVKECEMYTVNRE